MQNRSTHKLTLYAMLTALICVATMLHIPSYGGYSNLGDGMLLVGTFVIGPVWGMIVSAVGSAAADLILGCAYYIPGTLLVKGLSALIAGLLFSLCRKFKKSLLIPSLIISAIPAEIFMVIGYWLYKTLILGNPIGAVESVPRNIIQGIVGIAVSVLLYLVLYQIPSVKKVSYYDNRD